jgi:hypothetical protein
MSRKKGDKSTLIGQAGPQRNAWLYHAIGSQVVLLECDIVFCNVFFRLSERGGTSSNGKRSAKSHCQG